MNHLIDSLAYVLAPERWPEIGLRLAQHLGLVSLALLVAALVAVPLGIYLGHTGRGRTLVVLASGGLRALPSLGLLTGLALLGPGLRQVLLPATLALAILAIPPILAAIYAGMAAIPPEIIDSARGSGFAEWQIIFSVELPLAAEQILGGFRSALLQVIATATIAAYVGLGGLGRFIFDGLAVHDYPQMLAGSLLVIALALCVDLGLSRWQRQLRKDYTCDA